MQRKSGQKPAKEREITQSDAAQAVIEGATARLVCRVPTSSDASPINGASRTPADELPTITAAFFINSEKCAKRIDGITRNWAAGKRLIT